jgi:catechol 2,3-dioxygenase-like lactoylglutathione lyase family enzyme
MSSRKVAFDFDFLKRFDWLRTDGNQRDSLHLLRCQRHEPRPCLLRRRIRLETKRACRSGSLLHRIQRRRRYVRDREQPGLARSPDGMFVTFEVEDFEAAVRHLRDHDVPFFLGPTETKICQWVAFRDPDGNRLVIHKRK